MVTLREATARVLQKHGVEELRHPNRFVSEVVAQTGMELPEIQALCSQCDERFFVRFAVAAESGSDVRIMAAYEGGAAHLSAELGVDEYVAQQLCLGLAQGIADYLAASQHPSYSADMTLGSAFADNASPQPDHYDQGPRPMPRRRSVVPALAVALGMVGLVCVIVAVFVLVGKSHMPSEVEEVTVAFDANGATSGSVDAITCGVDEAVTLPDASDLTRKGYVFAGWGSSPDSSKVRTPGSTYATDKDVTFYAQWNLDPSAGAEVLSCDTYQTNDGALAAVLRLRNTSQATVDITAKLTFQDEQGNAVDQYELTSPSVGPGEETIMGQSSMAAQLAGVSYDVSVSVPQYGDESILTCATMKEVSCDDDGLVVRVTNSGKRTMELAACVAYGHDESGGSLYEPVKLSNDDYEIAPGQSRELRFKNEAWQRLDRKVYLVGFVK